jgi:sulfatase modifying factor 1
MQDFDICTIILKTVCPNNEIIYDPFGNPSVMVYIPKFRMNQMIGGGSDKVHPAFVVNGVERDGFYISKYLNTDVDGRGCSLPAVVPRNCVGIDLALEKCISKGRSWHLTTVQEWGAIALWCKKNGRLPNGNNEYGRDKRDDMFRGIPVTDVENGKGRVLTGTGPLSWSHDNTAAGIWDLHGNLSEWVGGIRIVFGEIQVMPDNDAADIRHTHAADSPAWRAIDAATGEYVLPDGKGTTKGSVKFDYIEEPPGLNWSSKWIVTTEIKNRMNAIRRCDMSFIKCDETVGPEAKELLVALGLIPDDPMYDYKEQYAYHNNGIPESFMYRGGSFTTGAFGGVFVWSCSFGHDHVADSQGFRASYIPL